MDCGSAPARTCFRSEGVAPNLASPACTRSRNRTDFPSSFSRRSRSRAMRASRVDIFAERGIILGNAIETDFGIPALCVRLCPRRFHVSEVAQPLSITLPIEFQDTFNRLSLRIGQLTGAAAAHRVNLVLAARGLPKCPHDRPVLPSLNRLREQTIVVPNDRPSLTVINELLDLHDSHGAASFQNILSYVECRRHRVLPE